jgi:proline iminopeptidase
VVEQDMTVIYAGQLGCSRSSSPKNNDYSLSRMVKDFEELRKHLGYNKWLLMPHFFGVLSLRSKPIPSQSMFPPPSTSTAY